MMSRSGTVCLDVINQTWSPMYELVNVFDIFLPQLLTYPNPQDPLNSTAAMLHLKDPEKYTQTVSFPLILQVKEYVQKYAKTDFKLASGVGETKAATILEQVEENEVEHDPELSPTSELEEGSPEAPSSPRASKKSP